MACVFSPIGVRGTQALWLIRTMLASSSASRSSVLLWLGSYAQRASFTEYGGIKTSGKPAACSFVNHQVSVALDRNRRCPAAAGGCDPVPGAHVIPAHCQDPVGAAAPAPAPRRWTA